MTGHPRLPGLTEEHLVRLEKNMNKIEELSRRPMEVMAAGTSHVPVPDGSNQVFVRKSGNRMLCRNMAEPRQIDRATDRIPGRQVSTRDFCDSNNPG